MKKLFALLLVCATLMSCFIGCNKPGEPTSAETSGKTSGATSAATSEQGYADLPVGTVRLTNVGTGLKLTYDDGKKPALTIENQNAQDAVGLNFINYKGDKVYCFEIAAKVNVSGKKEKNMEINENALTVKTFKDGTVTVEKREMNNFQLFYPVQNGDGSYTFLCRSNKSFALAMDGTTVCVKEDTSSDAVKWKMENISLDNDYYKEFISDEGNVAVRVPLDVFDKTTITAERLTQWASDLSDLMHVYDEMTQFHPHDTIFIHAYNYQGVMAGVIGTDQVYVNCGPGEWFYGDLQKMQDRTENGYRDISWMAMHEIGHLYDYNRDWNFEGECMTDIKVCLALYKMQDEGWVAAPAEYGANDVFGFHAEKSKKIKSAEDCCFGLGGKVMRGSYSIYHLAGVFAQIMEAIGNEPFYKTYNWFQNEMKPAEKPQNRVERFDLFLAKLSEYSGQDVRGMIKDAEYKICVDEFSKA